MSVSFLSMLLRAAIYLETTVACRLDLEKRMAMQLGQAVLDDLLIPSYSFTGDTLFDVDTVQRITTNYLESQTGNYLLHNVDDEYFSPPQSDVERVGKLMENYLAEIATDRNLPVPKFTCLAELIPEQSRPTEDGMYRAIDIYLKVQTTILFLYQVNHTPDFMFCFLLLIPLVEPQKKHLHFFTSINHFN